MITDVVIVATAFVLSMLGVRLFIDWLAARNLVAVENDRTMHKGRIPQGGGAPLLAAALVGALVPWSSLGLAPGTAPYWTAWHSALIPGMVGLAVLSFLNDRRDLAPVWRLIAHAAAAGLLLSALPRDAQLLDGLLPWWLERLVALVAIVWFMNLYNFMDGIDGIAGVETISIAAGALVVATAAGITMPLQAIALALIGATAGFLVWNWHPARIFMGDVGSIPIGLATGALLLHLAATVSLAAALILPLYYLVDATWTLAKRLHRREKVWQAHRTHAYQRSAKAIGSHSVVVVRIAACNLALVGAAVVALSQPVTGLALAVVTVAVLLYWMEHTAATDAQAARPLVR